jgi:DNA-binding transcriptional ArsR family regulator
MPASTAAARRRANRDEGFDNRMKAMQHPLRRRILLWLQEHGKAAPAEIARDLGEETNSVSNHLRMLVKYECAELVEEVKVGPSIKHMYRHTDRHLIDVGEWKDVDPAAKVGLLVDFMQPAVDDVTIGITSGTLGRDEEDWLLTRSPIHGLDQEGLAKALAIHERAFREILELPAECAERMKKSGEEPISVSSFQGCFEVPHF